MVENKLSIEIKSSTIINLSIEIKYGIEINYIIEIYKLNVKLLAFQEFSQLYLKKLIAHPTWSKLPSITGLNWLPYHITLNGNHRVGKSDQINRHGSTHLIQCNALPYFRKLLNSMKKEDRKSITSIKRSFIISSSDHQ